MMRILSLILLLIALPAQAAVTAQVDKNPVLVGETLTLTISSDSGGDDPELSPLEQDFQVLGSSSSSQFQMINGRTSRSHNWIIQLRPKQIGRLTIPSLQVGKDSTAPIHLEVKKPQQQAGQWPEAFVEFSADNTTPWLREQVLLEVKLYVRGNLVSGNFSEPKTAGAVIEQLGEQQESQAIRGNHRYRVIERRYALFAEQSGSLQIPGPIFNGEIAVQGQPQTRGMFGGFGRTPTRSIYAAGDAIELQVQAPPQNLAGTNWLPASHVTLQEQLQPDVKSLKVGEPITRIIKLTVHGQLHTQLPALDIATPQNTQAYTEPPQDETRSGPQGLIASRSYSTAIIAGQGQQMLLPAVELQWWDTRNNKLQTARIPARTIALQGNAAPLATSAPTTPTQPASTLASSTPAAAATHTAANNTALWLWQVAALTCAAGWLGTLLAWFFVTRRKQKPAPSQADNTLSRLRSTLKQADAASCRSALLAWARQHSGQTQTLSKLAQQTRNSAHAQALQQLDAAAFGHADSFDRETILAFVAEYNQPPSGKTDSALASLYPE